MGRKRSGFVCGDCGGETPRWEGRCPACGAWDALAAAPEDAGAAPAGPGDVPLPVPLPDVSADPPERIATGIGEFDRLLGGGLVPGAAVLLGGEPGVGKSTLLLQIAERLAGGGDVLYVTAEETLEQIALRARRIGATTPRLHFLAESRIDRAVAAAETLRPRILVADSVQLFRHPEAAGGPGSPGQVRRAAEALVEWSRRRRSPTVIVGHVTKEGNLAGPRLLEHLVDAVLYFEGDDRGAWRIVRAVKNRFGATDELAVFEMTGAGLVAAEDPSTLLLRHRDPAAPGSAVAVVQQGRRCLLVEVQALTVRSGAPVCRRAVVGIDPARVTLLAAVLERWGGLPLAASDLFVGVAGGLRIDDPAADLAVSAAIASSQLGAALPADAAWFGEVGLGGEVRPARGAEARRGEARRLGLRGAGGGSGPAGSIRSIGQMVSRIRDGTL
jgi:DNA repair protein RadA/Sms